MKHIVIIGNSAAGLSAAEAVRSQDNEVRISLIAEEPEPAYRRYLIGEVLSGKLKEKEIAFKSPEFYKSARIEWLKGQKAEKINGNRNQVVLSDKTRIEYDTLIIATGRFESIPNEVKGSKKHGISGFRSLAQVRDIQQLIPITNTVCVFGDGLPSLSAVQAFRRKGLEVKLISAGSRFLPWIDPIIAKTMLDRCRDEGVEVIFDQKLSEVFGNGDVKAVKISGGKVIGCGIVILDNTATAEVGLVSETEISTEGGGIRVTSSLCTDRQNVFAAGDVISTGFSGWERAIIQGRIAGENALAVCRGGELKSCPNIPQKLRLEFFGSPVILLGDSSGESSEQETLCKAGEGWYRKLVLQNNTLAGFAAVGNLNGWEQAWEMILSGAFIEPDAQRKLLQSV